MVKILRLNSRPCMSGRSYGVKSGRGYRVKNGRGYGVTRAGIELLGQLKIITFGGPLSFTVGLCTL